MKIKDLTLFKPYPFKEGEKIRISEGPRAGDWEVVKLSPHKITLQCPVSKREFSWDRFCYITEILKETEWPEHTN
ncbi:MAG: hypothetical protein H8E79_00940 [Desulfobulbaceae bacterium]|uniref:Uncharacterized protein n=1 Tax=Candidatus Desulfatifera sulfidica TaxID=2841691 RepID=A0A8J6N842_9BACT|nr:hypothetical protein [Candidatus Desulfatifera sulfidica]